jgi:hypothetical protein
LCVSQVRRPVSANFAMIAAECEHALADDSCRRLAFSLGLSERSLRRLNVGWHRSHRCYSFPMRDDQGRIVGIRLRRPNGAKFAVRGSQSALFMLADLSSPLRLFISEGPTDCAALLDMGLTAVGRPSCSGGADMLTRLIHRLRPHDVVIVADADLPGRQGAASLAQDLILQVPLVKVIEPPASVKDIREWKRQGATAADVLTAAEQATPRRMKLGVRMEGAAW